MRTRLHLALLFSLACLLGCTVPTTPATQTTASTSITGNWQIQSGTAITSPPTAPYLVGALQGTNSALTGTFTTSTVSGSTTSVVDYTGAVDEPAGVLELFSNTYYINLTLPTGFNTPSTGVIQWGCIPIGPDTPTCSNILGTPAVGVEVAPLNGTYTGTLTGTLYTDYQTTPISGTASLTLTQSATPNSSGQFPLTGVVTFPSSSGVGTVTLPGLVSGITLGLGAEGCLVPFSTGVTCGAIGPGSILNAYTNPTATQITVTSLSNINESNANSVFVGLTGTLTLQ
jgi:hypothetical protein